MWTFQIYLFGCRGFKLKFPDLTGRIYIANFKQNKQLDSSQLNEKELNEHRTMTFAMFLDTISLVTMVYLKYLVVVQTGLLGDIIIANVRIMKNRTKSHLKTLVT